jgi:heme/copper-type cytochrome/quinol oxidase subunit 1
MTIYGINITLHGLLMIFFLIMPGLFGGFGNILGPIFIGTLEVGYPRINNMSVLIIPGALLIILITINSEYGSGIGWTLYPPLSTSLMNIVPIVGDLILYGLLFTGISSSLTSVNFIVTLHIMKPYICPLSNMSVNMWSLSIIGCLLIIVIPMLTGGLLMLIADLHYNTVFFDTLYGGDSIFYQHLFWFFGHPEVYILILPAFGLLSYILSELLQVILFGNHSMFLAMSCISFLGSIVWSHHMISVGLEGDTWAYFMLTTLIISLPTGSKTSNWVSTYLNVICSERILIMYYIQKFLVMFTLGGSTGIILGNVIMDLSLHDTYYVISHFHYVLSLGTIISIITGICYYH